MLINLVVKQLLMTTKMEESTDFKALKTHVFYPKDPDVYA
jgi:hypothetical protein